VGAWKDYGFAMEERVRGSRDGHLRGRVLHPHEGADAELASNAPRPRRLAGVGFGRGGDDLGGTRTSIYAFEWTRAGWLTKPCGRWGGPKECARRGGSTLGRERIGPAFSAIQDMALVEELAEKVS